MRTINIHEAKTHLSRLVEEAAEGEAFIIAKAGRPIAKVVPLEARERGASRRIGFLAGQIEVPEHFDEIGRDVIEQMFDAGT